MKAVHTLFIFFFMLPTISQAEIWAFQINGNKVEDCNIRPEKTIDEVWNNLEKYTGKEFNLSRSSNLVLGYLLQNKELNTEYTFYRSKHMCEFYRNAFVAMLSGDQEKIIQFKNKLTKEERLVAMSPMDIPKKQKQTWVNAFAGCTNGFVSKASFIKGNLEGAVQNCDCVARKLVEFEENGGSENEIQSKMPEILASCQS